MSRANMDLIRQQQKNCCCFFNYASSVSFYVSFENGLRTLTLQTAFKRLIVVSMVHYMSYITKFRALSTKHINCNLSRIYVYKTLNQSRNHCISYCYSFLLFKKTLYPTYNYWSLIKNNLHTNSIKQLLNIQYRNKKVQFSPC